ncbi:hypothetical protein JMA_28970 [Jeotgalibacillus malaysiensis]|uniref:Acyltransferase 3 domain-containing protein n=1 Tax=Jeotgalibacillus malaysiensis TaxID=1508404 RepID=A0A0B5AW05_9BACL|nr:acyltransferase [Jeotgalibacillus malaysiensis]AJD92214.1 hypothetical protein JMA_28970 [Jeotgalibacillus malaysiensis]
MQRLYKNFERVDKLLDGNVSIYLDFIRGVAAILVVMEHLGSRLLVGYGNADSIGILQQVQYLLNMMGGPSVIVFFVLSGLLISRSIFKSFYKNKWSWKSYLISRLTRLMIVLIPALLLTFILDRFATVYFGYDRYDQLGEHIASFFGNLFFMQNVFVGTYGSNSPLWSLSYEFWYYMMFPLLLIAAIKGSKIIRAMSLLLFLSILVMIGTKMSLYFMIWSVGVLVLMSPAVKVLNKKVMLLVSIVLLGIAVVVRPLMMTGRLFTTEWTEFLFLPDLFISVTFGFFIYQLLHNSWGFIRNIQLKSFATFSKLIASFSFTLYLIHYPIINLAYYWAASLGYEGIQPGGISFMIEMLLVAVICVIAYAFSLFTEAKTGQVRNYVFKKAHAPAFLRRGEVVKKTAG